jgi:nitrogen fixation/metabolism regulation signal transduction histidine kinase
MRDSLRTRLTFSFVVVAVVPLMVAGLALSWRTFVVQREQALILQREVARRVASDTTAFLQGREDELRLMTDLRRLGRLETEQQAALLSAMLSFRQNVYEELSLLNTQGREKIRLSRWERFSSGELRTWSGRDEFEIPKAGGRTYLSSVSVDDVTGEPSMYISIPLIDLRSGEFTGLLLARFRFKTVWDLMATKRVGSESTVYLIDAQRRIIAHQDPSVVLRETVFDLPEENGFYKGLSGANAALAMETIRLHEQTYTVVAEQPASEALALAYGTIYTTALVIALSLFFAGGAGILTVRRIVHPLEILSTTAQVISAGDLSQQAEVHGRDEIGNLAVAFNKMTRQLRGLIGELEQNVTDLEETKETLQFRNAILSTLQETSLDGILVVGEHGEVVVHNQQFVDMWNMPPEILESKSDEHMVQFVLDSLEDPREFQNRIDHLYQHRDETSNDEIQLADGRITERYSAPMLGPDEQYFGRVWYFRDITERRKAQELMMQSEKMLSVGGLAAGMAHEINNPLGVILQSSQNVLRRVSSDIEANIAAAQACGTTLHALRCYMEKREILMFLEDVRESGERANEIVSNMLSFSRQPDGVQSSIDIAELLDRTLVLAETDYDLKKHHDFRQIEIAREYEANVPLVPCQSSKIQQVFLNILRNGAEAMKEVDNPAITPRFVLRVVAEAGMVCVEIEDNGPGMEGTTRRRVFEPFYTTKGPGEGTGLGMSVSYFIITEDHGGTLEVESQPGTGAKFTIRLPAKRNRP